MSLYSDALAHSAAIYNALVAAHEEHPESHSLSTLHTALNNAAHSMAAHLGTPVTALSGGTDKPKS